MKLSSTLIIVVFAVIYAVWKGAPMTDVLNDFNENTQFTKASIQMMTVGFCMNSKLVQKLNATNTAEKNTPEGDYAKQSIYSILYSTYNIIGTTESHTGVPYEFTFNTWGVGPSIYPDDDPQRFGKEAYRRLTDFDAVHTLIKQKGSTPINMLEVGCGTGAGANLTSHVHTNSHYTALDMQAQAIQTCKRLHEHSAVEGVRGRLQCIQANGMDLPFPPNTYDIVVISETHIAEMGYLTTEDKIILNEIQRVLRAGGLFVWGNAIPTTTWKLIIKYFEEKANWDVVTVNDVTEGAIFARDNDAERVLAYLEDIDEIFGWLDYFPTCKRVVNHLILDFYRHPGTRMYYQMVDESDSYMQACFQLQA